MYTAEDLEQWRAKAVKVRRFARLAWLVAIVAVAVGIFLSQTGGPAKYIDGAVVLTGCTLGFVLNQQSRRAELMAIGDDDPDDLDLATPGNRHERA